MAERNQNIYKRQLISFNPNFRIDTANPQMGLNGTDVYKIYGVTDSGDNQSSISLSSGGLFSVYNDHTIQISGGAKNEEGREDVVIIGNNGNVSISANGMIRLYATNIMIEAEEDIHFKAGRNISMMCGDGRVILKGQKVDIKGTSGNLPSLLNMDFTSKVFEGSFVGLDLINNLVSGIVENVVDTVIDTVF
ncbi:MAG: hypothetical protein ACO3UU_10800 [Minisyncoccia bacterium]